MQDKQPLNLQGLKPDFTCAQRAVHAHAGIHHAGQSKLLMPSKYVEPRQSIATKAYGWNYVGLTYILIRTAVEI